MQKTVKDNGTVQTLGIGEAPNPGIIGLGFRGLTIVALASSALAAIIGLAFAGWSTHGTDILMNYARSGLSWCL